MEPYNKSIILNPNLKRYSTKEVADAVLTSVATVSLIASLCDGSADQREVDLFMKNFREKFLLPRRKARQVVGKVLANIHNHSQENILDDALLVLRSHLDKKELLGIFEAVGDIVLADGKIHEGEEQFMDYLAFKLEIVDELVKLYAEDHIADAVKSIHEIGSRDLSALTESQKTHRESPIVYESERNCSTTAGTAPSATHDRKVGVSSTRVLFTLLSPTGRSIVEVSSE